MTVSYLALQLCKTDSIMRKSKPITITLGKQQRSVDRRRDSTTQPARSFAPQCVRSIVKKPRSMR
jgi:hypothetical protein